MTARALEKLPFLKLGKLSKTDPKGEDYNDDASEERGDDGLNYH